MVDLNSQTLEEINTSLKSVSELLKGIPEKVSAVAGWLRVGRQEVDKTAEASKKAADAAEKHAASQKKATDKVHSTGEAAKATGVSMQDMSNTAVASLGKFGISLDGLSSSAKLLESKLGKMIAAIGLEGTDKKVALATAAFSLFSTAALGLGKNLSSIKYELNAIGDETSASVEQDLGNVKKLFNDLGSFPGFGPIAQQFGPIIDKLGEFAKAGAAVRKMESNFIALRSQFGGFAREGSKMDFITNLPRELSRFNDIVIGTATQLNLSVDEVERYAYSMGKIPGAFDSIVRKGKHVREDTRLLEVAMRVARGTTGDFKDALGAMDLEFRQFGQATSNSLDYLSRMYEMAQAISVPFKDFKETVDNIVKGFSSLGNTSQSATELVGGLSRALMSTGIGIEPAKRIIEGITGSMQQMGIAQKAFLSQQTGGAGGLQGAFQIDQMMRQGDIRGVYEKMEQSLRQQFGGRIVTLDEGAQDSNAASQLTKQLEFLKQGPFGQMVKNDADAYRLLEAFKSGTGPTPDLLAKGDGAMGSALKADESIQEVQRDALIAISNETKLLVRESQIHTALMGRALSKDVEAVISRAEDIAKSRSLLAASPGDPKTDTFAYTGSQDRILSAAGLTREGELSGSGLFNLGFGDKQVAGGPDVSNIGLFKAFGKAFTDPGSEFRKFLSNGGPGLAPTPRPVMPPVNRDSVTTPTAGVTGPVTQVEITNSELKVILERDGEVVGRGVATTKMGVARSTSGTGS